MKRLFVRLAAIGLALQLTTALQAQDSQPAAVALVDKAIKAVGGEEALSKMKVVTWKAKGTMRIMDGDAEVATVTTAQGLDHFRQEMEGDFGGNEVQIVTAMAGDKGFRAYGGNAMDLTGDSLANQRRTVYLAVLPVTLVGLKGKDFKLETIEDDKVGDKPVAGIKVTTPDKKDFKLFFDKETGLPAKMVAKVAGFRGDDFVQETVFSEYKEMGGIKKATKLVSSRDGEKFIEQTITEFKAVDKVDPKTFTEAL